MTKKIVIISSAALVLVIALIIVIAVSRRGSAAPAIPKRISVYDSAAGAIYTPSYEDFLAGCVSGVLLDNVDFEPEALKAVAIAENTRIQYFLGNKSGFTDLGADIAVSEYLPYSPEKPSDKVREAAKDAAGLALRFNGEAFNAPMCRISTGRTDKAPPYSPSVGLPCDLDAPGYSASASFTPERVREALGGGNLSYNFAEWLHDPVYGENGTLRYIELCGERLTGETVRKSLGLRSTAITAEFAEDKFTFKTQGWGDNRGMSIYAANYLAKKGKTAEEILNVFYPEAEIAEIS